MEVSTGYSDIISFPNTKRKIIGHGFSVSILERPLNQASGVEKEKTKSICEKSILFTQEKFRETFRESST